MSVGTPVIEVRNVSFRYGDEPVLADITFSIEPGDFAALVGSNGAGKSTLLRLILGELAPDGGEIRLFGRPVDVFHDWPRIGYVAQNASAAAAGFPATAEEILLAGMYSRIGMFRPAGKIHRRQALDALRKVGMEDHARTMISALSGGQLQRVMIARVLCAGSEILLLDEPESGVDRQAADALYDLLCALNKNGMSILLVTHDTARAAQFPHYSLCLEEGSVVKLDREQVLHELSHKHKHPQG